MKWGIVGTNFISDSFMKGIQSLEEQRVVGVCSGKKENAISFSEKYHIESVFDSLEQMISSNKVDAIYLAVPNSKHCEMAQQCLEAKIPVFVEKPFVLNRKQVQQVLTTANTMKTYVHDGIVPLYSPNFKNLKEAISKIGELRQVTFTFSKVSSRYAAYLNGENPTTFRRELGNGSLMDLGVYGIAVAIGLFGKPVSVKASGHLLSTGVDGMGKCTLSYPTFDVDVYHSKMTNTSNISEIQGEKGLITIGWISLMKEIELSLYNGEKEVISLDEGDVFAHQLRDFQDSIDHHRFQSALVSHDTSELIIEILQECRHQIGVIYDVD